jgi:plasmid stabilization system protein ParE
VYADLAEAAEWYDRQQTGVGDRFLAAMRSLVEDIAKRPTSFAEVESGVRSAMHRRFPYKVYFRLGHDEIRVFAVLHGARHPDMWKNRSVAKEDE